MINNIVVRHALDEVYYDIISIIKDGYRLISDVDYIHIEKESLYKLNKLDIYEFIYLLTYTKLKKVYDDFILFEDDKKDEYYLKDKLKMSLYNIKTTDNVPIINDFISYCNKEYQNIIKDKRVEFLMKIMNNMKD